MSSEININKSELSLTPYIFSDESTNSKYQPIIKNLDSKIIAVLAVHDVYSWMFVVGEKANVFFKVSRGVSEAYSATIQSFIKTKKALHAFVHLDMGEEHLVPIESLEPCREKYSRKYTCG